MKGRITTVLSLTGVLVAGSAAALVNTEVLQSASTNGGNSVTLPPSTTVDSAVTTTEGAVTTLPITTIAPDTTLASVTTAAVSTQAVYQIGAAGLVTLDTAGDVLTIVSAVPNPGWMLLEAKNDDAFNIEVAFQTGTTRVEFHANLLFGVVGTSVETENVGGSEGTTPGSGTTAGGGTHSTVDDDDDDDDDDHHGDDDDHDDDDEGDDDHGGGDDD